MTSALIWLGLATLIAAPFFVLRAFGAQWKWFGLGIFSWIVAVLAKNLVLFALDAAGVDSWSISSQAALSGIVSAMTELGAAAWFLRRATLALSDALAFGAAIGSFEVLFVLLLGWLEGFSDPPASVTDQFAFVDAFLLLERLLALIGHTASRLLLYVGIHRRRPSIILLAIVLFSIVDGVASYGVLADWDWNSPTVLVGFYSFVTIVTGVEVAAAWRLWRPMPTHSPGATLGAS
jgi:uncharacterized membrane protein YhfC